MDWIVIVSMVCAGWVVLSALSGERMTRAQQVAIALAKLAADQAKDKENDLVVSSTDARPVKVR